MNKVYSLNFIGVFECRNNLKVYVNKDDAILNMVTAKDDFLITLTYNQNDVLEVQKSYHDLDCYLVQIMFFINGECVGHVELIELNVIGANKNVIK